MKAVYISLGAGVVLAFCGIWYVYHKAPKRVDLAQFAKEHVTQYPDPFTLNRFPTASGNRNHLHDGDFMVVHHMQDIPEGCVLLFYSSFVQLSAYEGRVGFADPGQPAQYGDSLIPNAPFRQLVFAGQDPNRCFVYYQHGGVNRPSYCLAVMDHVNKKMIWVGEATDKVNSIEELRALLSQDKFNDTPGPGC